MVDKVNGSGYMNSPEYAKLKKEHPKADIKYDEKTQSLKWTEKTGLFGSSSTGGTVYLDDTELSDAQKTSDILKQMDSAKLDEYINNGFLVPKKSILEGEYYEFDAAKYKEVTGKDITLGEIKNMLGLRDGVLRATNRISFKTHDNGDGRDFDTAPLSQVTDSQKIKVPKRAVFANDVR